MFVVQSEFAGIGQSVHALRTSGLTADVVASQQIPFGPVLNARASWLESTGRLRPGRREETLAVIRADKYQPRAHEINAAAHPKGTGDECAPPQ
jgi:release factor glutamine methyltransferase